MANREETAEMNNDTDLLLQRDGSEDEESDEELNEFIKENGGYESLLSKSRFGGDGEEEGGRGASLQVELRTELHYIKEAVLEALNPFTFLACFFVLISMYLSLIGWGPYFGPKVGPWLHSKGLPGGSQWVDIHDDFGGHRTRYTAEGEKRNHEYMKEFAENV